MTFGFCNLKPNMLSVSNFKTLQTCIIPHISEDAIFNSSKRSSYDLFPNFVILSVTYNRFKCSLYVLRYCTRLGGRRLIGGCRYFSDATPEAVRFSDGRSVPFDPRNYRQFSILLRSRPTACTEYVITCCRSLVVKAA